MKSLLKEGRHHMAQHLTATPAKVTELPRKIKDLATHTAHGQCLFLP